MRRDISLAFVPLSILQFLPHRALENCRNPLPRLGYPEIAADRLRIFHRISPLAANLVLQTQSGCQFKCHWISTASPHCSAFVLEETIIVTYSSSPASRSFASTRLSHDLSTLRHFRSNHDTSKNTVFSITSNIHHIEHNAIIMPALRKRPSITPSTPTPPALDRRNSSPSRQQCPGNATSILSKVVSIAPPRSTPSPLSSIPSSPNPSLSEGKAQWEAFNRRSSDNSSGMHLRPTCNGFRTVIDSQSKATSVFLISTAFARPRARRHRQCQTAHRRHKLFGGHLGGKIRAHSIAITPCGQ